MAGLASAISSMSSRRRKWRAPRPRSASATAPTRTSASTRSAAGAIRSRRSKYLPKLISGEHVGALAMSEAGAGSDVVGMKLKAEKVGNGYRLNGTKFWITNGVRCRHAGRLCQDGRGQPRDHRLPDREGHGGLLDRPEDRQAGYARLTDRELVFDDCFVPPENVLGEENKGVEVLMSGLDYERTVLAGIQIGIMQACLDVGPALRPRAQAVRQADRHASS